jgi:hypothetical protein
MLHGSMKLGDRLIEMWPYLAELAAVMAVVLLNVVAFGTGAHSLLFSVAIALSLVGVVIVFVIIIRGFRSRPAGVRETRDSLVSSYLAALDRTSLNPATQPPTRVPLRRHFDGDDEGKR